MQESSEAGGRSPRIWLIAMAVALAAILPFAASLSSGFAYDDHLLIEGRATVHSLRYLPLLFRQEFWTGVRAVHFHYFRPLVSASYAIDWTLWDGNPTGFHATNLAAHGAVTALVFLTLRRWTGRVLPSLLASLWWACHPSKVEAVSWIAGRTDVFCALGLLTMSAGTARRLRGDRAFGAGLEAAGLTVAFLSKELAIIAPALAATEAWVAGGRPPLTWPLARKIGKTALPHLAIASAYLILRAAFYPIFPQQAATLSVGDGALYAVETIGEFGRLVVWPWPLTLQRAPIRSDGSGHLLHDHLRLVWGVATLLGIVAVLTFVRRRRPGVAAGLLLAVAMFAPLSNVVPTRMIFLVSERFVYLPLLGLAFAIAEALPDLDRPGLSLRAPWAAIGAALLGFLPLTVRHTEHFLDDEQLWKHELDLDPDLPLGLRWACEAALRSHRPREALVFALRGQRGVGGWFLAQPYRLEFALLAVQALELLTRDRDQPTLYQIDDFLRGFLEGSRHLELRTTEFALSMDIGKSEVRWLQRTEPDLCTQVEVWAAEVAARTGQCARATRLAETFVQESDDLPGRVRASLVLGRCGDWSRAIPIAEAIDPSFTSAIELVQNLKWARDGFAAADAIGGLDGAMLRSRASTLVADRMGAYTAIAPFRETLMADPEGARYLARAAWAAGEDAVARTSLEQRMPEAARTALLARWSAEIGRD